MGKKGHFEKIIKIQDNTFSYILGAGGVATGSKGVMTMNVNRLVQIATREGEKD